jgi:hypothetical protein
VSQSLLQRATKLSGDLARFRTLQLSAQDQAVISQRVADLRAAREQLDSPITFLIAVRNDPELQRLATYDLDFTNALVAVDKANHLVQNDPQAVVKGSALAPVITAVRQAVQIAEAAAGQTWRQVVATMSTTMRSELLEVLGRIPSYSRAAEQLRALDGQVRMLAASPWVSPQELESFLELRRRAQRQWDQLGGTDALPASVLAFLIACGRDGAPLDSITPEITEWIERQGLRGVFRIRIGGG